MFEKYIKKTHFYGRISSWIILAVLLAAPFLACLALNAKIDWAGFAKGFVAVAPLYYAVAIIEVMTYIPMVGTGGTYIVFVTGNISNLKLPAALNALDQYGADIKTPEGEIISTISMCVSSIVNTAIIVLGIIIIAPFGEYLESETLAPAFNNVIPALFGALAVAFVGRNWKIAIGPVLLMMILFIAIPELNGGTVGIMVPVAVLITIGIARILYKKGKLD